MTPGLPVTPAAAVAVVRAALARRRCDCRLEQPDEAQRVVAELELEGWYLTSRPESPAGPDLDPGTRTGR